MSDDKQQDPKPELAPLGEEHNRWGELPKDNFGYESDEERRRHRGLEDWEMVEKIPESQRRVPRWFFAVILIVLLVAIGLSFPFWGDRPGYERAWVDMGFVIALVYLAVFGSFVYFMVNMYGSNMAGRLDSDREQLPDEILRQQKAQEVDAQKDG